MPGILSTHSYQTGQRSCSLHDELIVPPVRQTIFNVANRVASERADLLVVFLAQIFFYLADIFHIRTLFKYK